MVFKTFSTCVVIGEIGLVIVVLASVETFVSLAVLVCWFKAGGFIRVSSSEANFSLSIKPSFAIARSSLISARRELSDIVLLVMGEQCYGNYKMNGNRQNILEKKSVENETPGFLCVASLICPLHARFTPVTDKNR